jgi:hypothetical protein
MVFLQSNESESIFKTQYEDPRMIGKHFRVRNSQNLNVHRHYTVSSVMEPNLYMAYLTALESDDASKLQAG